MKASQKGDLSCYYCYSILLPSVELRVSLLWDDRCYNILQPSAKLRLSLLWDDRAPENCLWEWESKVPPRSATAEVAALRFMTRMKRTLCSPYRIVRGTHDGS